MADIENVPQLCDALMAEDAAREDILVKGSLPESATNRFTDLADEDFLAPSVEGVDNFLANEKATEHEEISVLEVNAFLACAQNSYGLSFRDAFERRLGRVQQKQLLYKSRGVLDDQLKLVGTLVDPPALLQQDEPSQ